MNYPWGTTTLLPRVRIVTKRRRSAELEAREIRAAKVRRLKRQMRNIADPPAGDA